MEHQFLHLGEDCFKWINGALLFLSLAANIFYACCLIFPLQQRLKQPLKALLEYLVWCSIMYCVSLPLLHFPSPEADTIQKLSWLFVLFFTYCSMTSSSWLNFFYFLQIVPQKRVVLIWLKKNIRPFIYVALVFDVMLILLDSIMNIAYIAIDLTYINGTEDAFHDLDILNPVALVITKVHILVCLCVMVVSSFCTVRYLFRHMRNMTQSGRSFHTLRIKSHKRVTFAGISQGVLYFLFGVFYFIDTFTLMFSPDFNFTYRVHITVTSLYIFGTTVNMGIGQALFIKRAADIWMALKTLVVEAMVTNDMKLHSSQMTSDEIVTVTGQMM